VKRKYAREVEPDEPHVPGRGRYGCWDPDGMNDIHVWWEHPWQIPLFVNWVRMWIGERPIYDAVCARNKASAKYGRRAGRKAA
jgi:hypothetical protein